MNGEELANKSGIEEKNRFFFSDDYYNEIPEVPEKNNFDPFQPPKKSENSVSESNSAKNLFNNDLLASSNTGMNNTGIQQASSLDQVLGNNYQNESEDTGENVFNFFAHRANTEIDEQPAPMMQEEPKEEIKTVEEEKSKESFFSGLTGKRKKPKELEVVHVGTDIISEENQSVGQVENNFSIPQKEQTSFSNDSMVQNNNSLNTNINYNENEPLQQTGGFSFGNDSVQQGNNSVSESTNIKKSEINQPTGRFSFMSEQNQGPNNSFDFSKQNDEKIESIPSTVPLMGGFSFTNEPKQEEKKESQNMWNSQSTPMQSTNNDYYKPNENENNNFFFGTPSGPLSDIERAKSDISAVEDSYNNYFGKKENKVKEEDVDFIAKLKNQETADEQNREKDMFAPRFGTDAKEEERKDFLLERKEETPIEDIEVPERKLQYGNYYNGELPKEENKFIMNDDTSVPVDDKPRELPKTVIPDFMSGSIGTQNFNIETGVDRELEAELLKQRSDEEARIRSLNPELQAYELTARKPKTQMVYKAGGKSYIRDVVEKPKVKPRKKIEESKEEVKKEAIIEPPPAKEPKSLEELIESIVGVPGLENLEVKLNPYENPGVRFGFKEKEDKKVVEEDQPTNVYDEKKDNFDYDQNFENVEIIKSTILDELAEKAKNENKISILARYGEDFCARDYITNPAIGRAEEIKQLILILLTPEKSGILIGKPGIGKTSIVEGLAYQLQRNNVPDALKGYCIVSVKTPSLLGTLPTGETRLQTLVDELKDLDKIILFIDEIHMLIGATNDSAMDFANMFKESLGRGTIKVIGATTTEEYERYILRDKAFVRRFQKVEVEEPSREHTIKILMGTLPKIEKSTGAKLKYTEFMKTEIMAFIVDITTEYKRIYGIGSRYPDICLTLLSQAFSQAVFANRKEVNINDIRKAIENSKNIYPDVIKKELINFDRKFKDLIREESAE